MQTPVIPESAPFDPQQRAWLNGFFAGLIPPAPGSSSGAATAVLEEPLPVEAEDFSWHDASLALSERLALAKDRPFPLQLMAAMAQLDCGACGYQCETYAAAIAAGTEKSLTRCAPGAAVTSKALKNLVKQNSSQSPASITATITEATDRPLVVGVPLLTVKKLNGEGSTKDTRFVALDLAESDLQYEAGDSLGVYPRNDPSLIKRILDVLPTDAQTPVPIHNQPTSLQDALQNSCVVTALESEVVSVFAQYATQDCEREELQNLADDDEALASMDLLDLLEQYPAVRPAAKALIEALPELQPRLYSIASSPKAYPQEVHLTVGVVRYQAGGRVRQGVASNYLANRVEPGETVKVFVQKAHDFALPSDPTVDIIMIGAGTGIAPFRAFLQERSILKKTLIPGSPPGITPAPGKTFRGETRVSETSGGGGWLFFGDQRRETDFLYERELLQYQKDQVLSQLTLAFSRDQKEKIYVQHRMLQEAQGLWQWLERGAYLYVCGDARQMARDVDQALHQIVSQEGGLNEQAAKQYLAQLKKTGRYQRDVY